MQVESARRASDRFDAPSELARLNSRLEKQLWSLQGLDDLPSVDRSWGPVPPDEAEMRLYLEGYSVPFEPDGPSFGDLCVQEQRARDLQLQMHQRALHRSWIARALNERDPTLTPASVMRLLRFALKRPLMDEISLRYYLANNLDVAVDFDGNVARPLPPGCRAPALAPHQEMLLGIEPKDNHVSLVYSRVLPQSPKLLHDVRQLLEYDAKIALSGTAGPQLPRPVSRHADGSTFTPTLEHPKPAISIRDQISHCIRNAYTVTDSSSMDPETRLAIVANIEDFRMDPHSIELEDILASLEEAITPLWLPNIELFADHVQGNFDPHAIAETIWTFALEYDALKNGQKPGHATDIALEDVLSSTMTSRDRALADQCSPQGPPSTPRSSPSSDQPSDSGLSVDCSSMAADTEHDQHQSISDEKHRFERIYQDVLDGLYGPEDALVLFSDCMESQDRSPAAIRQRLFDHGIPLDMFDPYCRSSSPSPTLVSSSSDDRDFESAWRAGDEGYHSPSCVDLASTNGMQPPPPPESSGFIGMSSDDTVNQESDETDQLWGLLMPMPKAVALAKEIKLPTEELSRIRPSTPAARASRRLTSPMHQGIKVLVSRKRKRSEDSISSRSTPARSFRQCEIDSPSDKGGVRSSLEFDDDDFLNDAASDFAEEDETHSAWMQRCFEDSQAMWSALEARARAANRKRAMVQPQAAQATSSTAEDTCREMAKKQMQCARDALRGLESVANTGLTSKSNADASMTHGMSPKTISKSRSSHPETNLVIDTSYGHGRSERSVMDALPSTVAMDRQRRSMRQLAPSPDTTVGIATDCCSVASSSPPSEDLDHETQPASRTRVFAQKEPSVPNVNCHFGLSRLESSTPISLRGGCIDEDTFENESAASFAQAQDGGLPQKCQWSDADESTEIIHSSADTFTHSLPHSRSFATSHENIFENADRGFAPDNGPFPVLKRHVDSPLGMQLSLEPKHHSCPLEHSSRLVSRLNNYGQGVEQPSSSKPVNSDRSASPLELRSWPPPGIKYTSSSELGMQLALENMFDRALSLSPAGCAGPRDHAALHHYDSSLAAFPGAIAGDVSPQTSSLPSPKRYELASTARQTSAISGFNEGQASIRKAGIDSCGGLLPPSPVDSVALPPFRASDLPPSPPSTPLTAPQLHMADLARPAPNGSDLTVPLANLRIMAEKRHARRKRQRPRARRAPYPEPKGDYGSPEQPRGKIYGMTIWETHRKLTWRRISQSYEEWRECNADVDAYASRADVTNHGHTANSYLLTPQAFSTAKTQSLNKIFDDYREPESPVDSMGAEGAMKYLESLGVNLEETVVLAVLTQVGAPSMGEMTRQEFVQGWESLGAETLAKQRSAVSTFRTQLGSDAPFFREVYRHSFVLALQEGQKFVALETALEFWRLLFSSQGVAWRSPPARTTKASLSDDEGTEWLALWLDFLTERWRKSVSRDMWLQTLAFARRTLDDPTMAWWNEDSAWPSVIDDFVAYVREKRQSSSSADHMDTT